jgi:hypothetical protein
MTQEDPRERNALYAIGALDPISAREVEEHLRSAPDEERQEVAEIAETAAMLPFALPLPALPEGLKDRVMARVAAEELMRAQPAKVIPFAPRQRRTPGIGRYLAYAATIALAALSGILFLQNNRLERERDDLARQAQGGRDQLAKAQESLNGFLSPATRIIKMVGDAAPKASAKLVWDTDTQQWVIYFYDLPGLPPDKDYQLWYITTGQEKLSASLFQPGAGGKVEVKVTVPADVAPRLAATAVTLEPKGGSSQPTGKIYLKAAI